MKVTISVAIYNVAPYIEECVRSLYEQTLEDIEILLVDDCSPDDSIEIAMRVLEEYPERKGRVRAIRHPQNQGTSDTKRDGILEAQGEYVIVIDGDDYVDRRMAEVMYAKAVETGADMVISDFARVYAHGQVVSTLVPDGVIGDGDNVRRDLINRRVPPFNVTKLIKKSLFVDNDVVWPQKCFGEDTVFNVVSAYYAKRIVHVDEPLYYYRYNTVSISHKKMSVESCIRNYDEFKLNFTISWDFLRREGADGQYRRGEIINKLRTKNRLLPVTDQRKYRRLWWKTYPEINKILLFGNKYYKSTYREWVWIIAIMLGLYPRYKKRLHRRRFLPSKEWV